MSAICGFWLLHGDANPRRVCERMLQSLAAHGPDGCSLAGNESCHNADGSSHTAGSSMHGLRGVALGHRLLKITAEDELEAQPLPIRPLQRSSIDPLPPVNGWLVADARIDNRAQLAAELGISANEAAGMADSAMISSRIRRRISIRWPPHKNRRAMP